MTEPTTTSNKPPRVRTLPAGIHTYPWHVPMALFREAQALCQAQQPPLAMRWLLIQLLAAWVARQKAPKTDLASRDTSIPAPTVPEPLGDHPVSF
jgi:hypothetical protein